MPYQGRRWSLDNVAPGKIDQRKNTGVNHPKNALVYFGHGSEGLNGHPKKIIIPPGQIVVIKAQPGEVRQINELQKDLEHFLNKDNSEYLLDPVKYIDKITDFFGSVAIYREGDSCPNIANTKLLNWKINKKYHVALSGAIKLPNDLWSQSNLNLFKNIHYSFPLTMTLKQYYEQEEDFHSPTHYYISDIYKLAVMQNFLPFQSRFEDILNDLNYKSNGEMLLSDALLFIEDSIKTNLENIYKSIKQPTVIYMFACRFVDGHEQYIPESIRLGTNNVKSIITSDANYWQEGKRQVKKNNNRNRNVATKRARVSKLAPEIREGISESILQRRLSAKAYSKKNETRKKSSITKNYIDDFRSPYLYKYRIDKLKQVYPKVNLNNEYIDDEINFTDEDLLQMKKEDFDEKITALKFIPRFYPNRKNDINKAYERMKQGQIKRGDNTE